MDTEKSTQRSRLSRLLSRSPKLSSVIAGEIRSFIITNGLKPGDSLPIEKAMIDEFGVSRNTIREALKELEVQGLIRNKTGPSGGPVIEGVGSGETIQAIQNFCYFHDVTVRDIYQLRSLLEVEMVASAVGNVDEATFARLEELVRLSARPATDSESRRLQREAEFEFHNVIARRSRNPLMTLLIEVITGILVNATAGDSAEHERHSEWSLENSRYHGEIVAALRRQDVPELRRLMSEHMERAHDHLQYIYGDISLESIALSPNDRS